MRVIGAVRIRLDPPAMLCVLWWLFSARRHSFRIVFGPPADADVSFRPPSRHSVMLPRDLGACFALSSRYFSCCVLVPAGHSVMLPRDLGASVALPWDITFGCVLDSARRPHVVLPRSILNAVSVAHDRSRVRMRLLCRDDGFCGTEVVESFLGKPRSVRSRQPAEQSTRGLSPRLQLRPR